MNATNPGERVAVALGANVGDAAGTIRWAFGELSRWAVGEVRVSSLWSSEPVDCPPGSPPFINAAACFQVEEGGSPEALLAGMQAIERAAGRQPKTVLNEPRPLDLDLIVFGRLVRNDPGLVLPHPRAHERRFVLEPLAEIWPGLVLPGQEQTVRGLLEALPRAGQVTRLR